MRKNSTSSRKNDRRKSLTSLAESVIAEKFAKSQRYFIRINFVIFYESYNMICNFFSSQNIQETNKRSNLKKRLYSEKGSASSSGHIMMEPFYFYLGTPKSMTTSEDFSSDILNTLNKLKESTSRYANKNALLCH